MIISSEEGRYLNEMFPSFRAQNDDIDEIKQEIPLEINEFHFYNNCPNSSLMMNIPTNYKPSFYVKKQIILKNDEKSYYYKSIQTEKKIFLENYHNKIEYEQKYHTQTFDCTKIDENCKYSPFLSYAVEDENNSYILPFYPAMSLRFLISNNIKISDTDKQVWAYELSCAFQNLHQRNLCHSNFTSEDVFLTSSLDNNQLNSSSVHFNIVLGNLSYDLDHEKIKSKLTEAFFYRGPEFNNDPATQITNAKTEQLKKNDVFSFGVFMNELIQLKTPQDIINEGSRQEKLEIVNNSEPYIYFNVDKNSNIKWSSLIMRCIDRDPNKRPNFDEIKEYLRQEEFFLPNVNLNEFENRIKNVRTDTTCNFETLAYVNKKYPSFQIIEHILLGIKKIFISRYGIQFKDDPKLSIVDQIFLILNSSSYFVTNLIEEYKNFFYEFSKHNPHEILKTYTKNENIIDFFIDCLHGEKNSNAFPDTQEIKTELMMLNKELKKLAKLYYTELSTENSTSHTQNIQYSSHLYTSVIPISEDQIKIIYYDIFNSNLLQTIDFLNRLQNLSDFNLSFFRSLLLLYTKVQNILSSSENVTTSISQINDIYKSIYKAILKTSDTPKIFSDCDNPIISLIEAIMPLINLFDEIDQQLIKSCINTLQKGLKTQKNSHFMILNFSATTLETIFTSEERRRNRVQSKKIEITGLAKSSLRPFLTRIVKSYQSSYKIELTIKLDNTGSKDPIKMCDIKTILEKLGVTKINSLPNSISFTLNDNL